MGPNGVWNLHEIWVMVILVTGISLAGYLLAKVFGGRKGILLAGIIGGSGIQHGRYAQCGTSHTNTVHRIVDHTPRSASSGLRPYCTRASFWRSGW
jgi:hypothetical protein